MDIESLAVNEVQRVISSTKCLIPFINIKDREPMWDGYIYVFSDDKKTNESQLGRIAVQVKGQSAKDLKKDIISRNIKKNELKNYMDDGGVLYFLVLIKKKSLELLPEMKIYYNALTPSEIDKVLSKTGEKKTAKIEFKPFPENEEDIYNCCVKFLKNRDSLNNVNEYINTNGRKKLKQVVITVLALSMVMLWSVTKKLFLYDNVKDAVDISYEKDEETIPGKTDRVEYTTSEIENGILNHDIVLNSVVDSTYGNEFDFVMIKEYDDNEWKKEIHIIPGKKYRVRIFVCNDNPGKYDDYAENVIVTADIQNISKISESDLGESRADISDELYEAKISVVITSTNDLYGRYYDDITFYYNEPFKLTYEEGSTIICNNGFVGNSGGCIISDAIVHEGTGIGYNALDGCIPGGIEYASYIYLDIFPIYN